MNFFEQRLQKRDSQQAFSVGGKIRVGTKAISKRAAENPTAAKLYQQVLQGVLSFRDAEKRIAQELKINNPFYPRNTREFHAHPWDMGAGGRSTTEKLLSLYGEQMEGDQKPKLYRFPIVFPEVGGKVESIIQGGMSVQGGGPNTIRYWSAFNETGQQVCKHLPEVKKSDMAQRRAAKQIRHPERQPVVRGLCVPEECNEFGMGMCRFNGTLRFYIPGVTGAGVFELATGSTLAATEIYQRIMQAVRAMGGRFYNYTPDGRPVFWLTKKRATRKFFDEEGNPKIGEQWVPEIDMEIEMPKVIMIQQAHDMARDSGRSNPVFDRGLAMPSSWEQQTDHAANSATEDLQSNPEVIDAEPHQAPASQEPAPADRLPEEQSANEPRQRHQEAQVVNTSVAPAGDAVGQATQMRSHAERHGYMTDLEEWVHSKFSGDYGKAHQTWLTLSERYGARIKDYFALAMLIQQMGINGELVMKYLKLKYGPMGGGARLGEMLGHIQVLCADGASVATSVMEELVEDATA